MQKIFEKITHGLALVFVFLLPIIIVPFFTDPFDFGRQVFVLVFLTLIFGFWLAKSLLEKKVQIQKNLYFWPIFLLLAVSLLSTLTHAVNKLPSLLAVNGALNLFLSLLVIVLVSTLNNKKSLFYALTASGGVLALISIVLNLFKFTFPITIPLLGLNIGKNFSPTGSLLSHLVALLMIVPFGFALVFEELKEKRLVRAGILSFANVLMLCGLGLVIYSLNNEAKPILLPQATAWAIAVETIKSSKMAISGIGPGNFVDAFTAYKPLSFNASEFWNARFNVSSNWYYQILTEMGILGLLLYINLAWKILKNGLAALRKQKIVPLNLAVYISAVFCIVAQLFLPLNLSIIFLFFIVLALTQDKEEKVEFDTSPLGNTVVLFLIFPILLFGGLIFFTGRTALANAYFLNSIKAANKNDGIGTYNLQIKSIDTDKTSPAYRIAYSQTNLALANNLSTKKDLTDQDRSTITQLVQQSIREAKAAVTLNPNSVDAWENLSNIYRQLINFAEGADQWTVSAYQEAIKYDPLNPRLRLDLGGVFYNAKNYNQAVTYFLQATNLKPDYVNAYYNLANTLKEAGAYADAKIAYETTLSLVKIDSADYQKVAAELEEVKKKLPPPAAATPATQPATLSTPQKPSAGIKPPVEVPEGEPPVTQPTGNEEVNPPEQPQP